MSLKKIEIIVDSHAVVRNNAEGSFVCYARFPPVVTFYQNKDVDIDPLQ